MELEIWSDVVCPWCAIGKRRLESALARFPHRGEVTVRWRSFELDPGAPAHRDEPLVDHLATKYGISAAEAQAMIDRMSEVAAEEGLAFRLDRARGGNTFAAHQLLHLAGDRGVHDAVKERLLTAYLNEGEPIGDRAVLPRLVAEAGLDAGEAADVLARDAYATAVRADAAEARRLGVAGVPCFVVGRVVAVSGAQPAAVLGQALARGWAAHTPASVSAGGPACTDACCGAEVTGAGTRR